MSTIDLSAVLPDTPENRTAFMDALYEMEAACLKHEEAAAAANLPAKIEHPPTLLVAYRGRLGVVGPGDCHPEAVVIAGLVRGVVTVRAL